MDARTYVRVSLKGVLEQRYLILVMNDINSEVRQ